MNLSLAALCFHPPTIPTKDEYIFFYKQKGWEQAIDFIYNCLQLRMNSCQIGNDFSFSPVVLMLIDWDQIVSSLNQDDPELLATLTEKIHCIESSGRKYNVRVASLLSPTSLASDNRKIVPKICNTFA